ncbi:MAG TPA: hypothetical protein VGF27_11420 [Pseudoduganella sp.]
MFVPDEDGAIPAEFEQRSAPPPAQLSAPRPGEDLSYLMPGGGGVQPTSYYTGIQQSGFRPEYVLTDPPRTANESTDSSGMNLLGGGALVFVLIAKGVARQRRFFRRKYRLLLGTKAEYKRLDA